MLNLKYAFVSLCRIKDFKLSCFGCCGHDFGTKDELKLAIKKNNFEFLDKKSLKEFKLENNSLRECGVCRCVVNLTDGTLGCPLHPKQTNEGEDLRTCNILFECKKSFLYRTTWDEKKRKKFLDKVKEMDCFDYSLFMSKDEDFE